MHSTLLLASLASIVSAIHHAPSLGFPSLTHKGFDMSTLPNVSGKGQYMDNYLATSVTWASSPKARLHPKPVSAKLNRRAGTLPPRVASVVALGNATDPTIDRDSCGSSRVGGKILWVCRDTEDWDQPSRSDQLPLIVNTAGYGPWSSTSGPPITPAAQAPVGCASNGTNAIYQLTNSSFTSPYYPVASDMCPSSGLCADNSRWVYWPNSPPLITTNQTAASKSAIGYTWIDKKHISGLTQLNPGAPYTLFKSTWSGQAGLPTVTVVADTFWNTNETGFGNYGGVIRNGYAYLFGQNNASQTLLARVPQGSIETRSAYQFWNNSGKVWTTTVPYLNNTQYAIPNAGSGGQGTFYFSSYFNAYLWIGQGSQDYSANYYLNYATQPTGPWSNFQLLFSGQNANGSFIGAYSQQAHPAMLPSINAGENYIYLSHTVPLASNQTQQGGYWTPLYNLTWA